MTFGMMQHLAIEMCDTSEDAAAKGHVYREGFKPIEIEKVIVVRKGTEAGNPTVDLVLRTQEGEHYVVMLTGNLLKSIPC